MEPRIHTITLAVEDLERALVFCRDGLGLESDGVVGAEFHDDVSGAGGAIAMFRLAGGLVLSLYPRTELAKDAGIPHAPPTSGEVSLGHFLGSRDEVDRLVEHIGRAGGTPLEKPRDRPWGIYSGYVQDPDGHLWEIMHSPLVDPNAS